MTMKTFSPNDSLYNRPPNIQKGIGFSPKTLSDWLATSPGSQRSAQFGYFGPGSLLRKDITAAGDPLQLGDFFTDTYGAKVWDSLNSQTRTFNLVRKVAWGPTTGWRIRSGRNLSTQGVSETGALPETDSPDLQTINIRPSFIVTSMGVSALAQFVATLEGGIGDALAVEQESAEVDHLKVINRMLMAPAMIRVASTAGNVDTLVAGGGDRVFINDSFFSSASESTANYATVSSIAGDAVTTTDTGTPATATDTIFFTRTRGGVWSLDDIVNEDGRTVNGTVLTNGPLYGNLTFGDRAADNWNAAGHISSNSGTLRHLATSFIDIVVQNIRQNGFNPDLFITGVEQEVRLGTILQANQHFMGEGKFQVKMGGEATLPGYETGFELATYKKIPIFTDVDTAPVWQLAGNGDALRGTDFFVFDTRFLEMPVLFTTQYLESRDYIHNNLLGIKAIFLTAMNTRCLNFRAQGKITDLTDGVNAN